MYGGHLPLERAASSFETPRGTYELEAALSSIPLARESAQWFPAKLACAAVPKTGMTGSGLLEPEPEQEPGPDRTMAGRADRVVLVHTAGPQLFFRPLTGSEKTERFRQDTCTRLDSYKAQPGCLDLRPATKDNTEKGALVFAAVGLRSGDVLAVDPQQQRVLAHWNKENVNAEGRCTAIAWDPRCPTQCVAGFSSGCLLTFDMSRTKEENLCSTKVEVSGSNGMVTKPKGGKCNPFSRWKLGKATINALRFSPPALDGPSGAGLLAVAAQDGTLKLFDVESAVLTLTLKSYFGGLKCVDWSADGYCLVTGGEDDNLVVWSIDRRTKCSAEHSSSGPSGTIDAITKCAIGDNRLNSFAMIGA